MGCGLLVAGRLSVAAAADILCSLRTAGRNLALRLRDNAWSESEKASSESPATSRCTDEYLLQNALHRRSSLRPLKPYTHPSSDNPITISVMPVLHRREPIPTKSRVSVPSHREHRPFLEIIQWHISTSEQNCAEASLRCSPGSRPCMRSPCRRACGDSGWRGSLASDPIQLVLFLRLPMPSITLIVWNFSNAEIEHAILRPAVHAGIDRMPVL